MAKYTGKYKEGDRVRIIKGTRHYFQAQDQEGTVELIGFTADDWLKVKFDNGYMNGYQDSDLEFVKPPEPKTNESYSIF